MTFVPEPELYSFMLRGYHLFSECLPSAWIGDINHIIDEMNVSGFDQFRYPNVKMEPMYDSDGKLTQTVVRNILEADAIFRNLLDLDFILPWIVTLLNRSPRLTENYGYFRNANRPVGYHAVRNVGQT